MSAKCKSCFAEIRWVKTYSGKAMPVDAKPEKRFVITGNNDKGEPCGEIRDTYISHFATCPQADAFRKKDNGK
jgi:hypothetical protein